MIGQVIYNLEDYAGSGGLITTSKHSLEKIIASTNNPNINGGEDYEVDKVNIFEKNILNTYGISSVYRRLLVRNFI